MTRLPEKLLFGHGRVLVWFSCGAASAVAAKLAVEHYRDYHVEVLYCDTSASEHPDNLRFLADVERWIGLPIQKLHSPLYRTIIEVFQAVGYLRDSHGAPCTQRLKRNVRKAYQRKDHSDLHIFGFTSEEAHRKDDFEQDNPLMQCSWLLFDHGITRQDCYRMLQAAGIELPAMYRLGYRNNNCLGCVKGGAGYWNKIRRDFPEVFDRMAALERQLDFALLMRGGKPCFLDTLPKGVGRYEEEDVDMSCGPQCAYKAIDLQTVGAR
jgi:3'-phosphoadenosine 5'-phosphosulfate sulfotransferase (PAPS reductase)/FAD synthetase